MYRFDHVVPEVDAIVAVDCRVVRQDAAANVDRYMRGDDCSDAAPSKAPLEVDPRPGSGTVIVIDTSRNAGSKQPVPYLQIAKSNRLEKDVPVHQIPLSLIFWSSSPNTLTTIRKRQSLDLCPSKQIWPRSSQPYLGGGSHRNVRNATMTAGRTGPRSTQGLPVAPPFRR